MPQSPTDATRDPADVPGISDEDQLRERIAALLASGLDDVSDLFPGSDRAFVRILDELKGIPRSELARRLAVGGFRDHPAGTDDSPMRCQECIYFLPHRRWCDLPELSLPVEPDWYCRLWKV